VVGEAGGEIIPQNREIWTLDRFDDFVAARRALIIEKFSALGLVQRATRLDGKEAASGIER
jgi:hypothetical protein